MSVCLPFVWSFVGSIWSLKYFLPFVWSFVLNTLAPSRCWSRTTPHTHLSCPRTPIVKTPLWRNPQMIKVCIGNPLTVCWCLASSVPDKRERKRESHHQWEGNQLHDTPVTPLPFKINQETMEENLCMCGLTMQPGHFDWDDTVSIAHSHNITFTSTLHRRWFLLQQKSLVLSVIYTQACT